jgi:hypothetical protein
MKILRTSRQTFRFSTGHGSLLLSSVAATSVAATNVALIHRYPKLLTLRESVGAFIILMSEEIDTMLKSLDAKLMEALDLLNTISGNTLSAERSSLRHASSEPATGRHLSIMRSSRRLGNWCRSSRPAPFNWTQGPVAFQYGQG